MGFWNRDHVKAGRKVYRCDSCRQPIEVGQPSVVCSGVNDGEFSSYRVHPECDDLWNQIYRELDCWDGMDVDTIEALGLNLDELEPTLQSYAEKHPVAVERLMVTVRRWKKEREE